jgi:thioredoxin 1
MGVFNTKIRFCVLACPDFHNYDPIRSNTISYNTIQYDTIRYDTLDPIMSCCIGGVCIPYTAIVPVFLLGFKWIVQRLAELGILPQFIANALGISIPIVDQHNPIDDDTNNNNDTKNDNDTNSSNDTKKQPLCCSSDRCATRTNDSPSNDNDNDNDTSNDNDKNTTNVVSVTSQNQWNTLLLQEKRFLVVQFTARWCQPCHAMAPRFAEFALQYPAAQFCTVDVDDMEDVASSFQIVMMPTFVCFNDAIELGRKSTSQMRPLKEWIASHIHPHDKHNSDIPS